MKNSFFNFKPNICKKHNQPIRYYDQNSKTSLCEVCSMMKSQLIPVEQIQSQYQEILISEHQKRNFLKDQLIKYKESFESSLNKIIQQINDQINCIKLQKESMEQLGFFMNQCETKEDMKNQFNNDWKSNEEIKAQINNLIRDFKQQLLDKDYFPEIVNQQQFQLKQTQIFRKIRIEEIVEDHKMNMLKFQYDLIQKEITGSCWSYDFAVDKTLNTFITATDDGIRIHEFQNQKIKDWKCSLTEHSSQVICLYQMKNTQSFASGSDDNSVIIWRFDKDNKWKLLQKLKDHSNYVSCITMNSQEFMLLSGSEDKSIKCWKKLNSCWKLSQTIDLGYQIYSTSLNEKEDKLIACGKNDQVSVLENQNDQSWKIVQRIKVSELGFRLCFTIEGQFVFQPETNDYLEVFQYDDKKKQFEWKSKILVQRVEYCQDLFPCQYVKALNLLTVKHGNFVNIFKVDQTGEYHLIQSIDFECSRIYGRMTPDGEYLITWDEGSFEIQVRKLQYSYQQ